MHKDNKRSKVYKRIREKLNRIKRIKLKNLIKTKLCRFLFKPNGRVPHCQQRGRKQFQRLNIK